MIKFVFSILLFISCLTICGQDIDSIRQSTRPESIPAWTLFVPGASYYDQRKIGQGLIYSVLEAGGIYMGIKFDKTLRNNSSSPYYNYPLWIGLQAYQTEKLTLLSNRLEIIKHHQPGFKYDAISDKDLYLSPFRKQNILTPITGGMILLAGIFLGIEKYNETESIREVDEMYFLNRYIGRNSGLAVFGATSLAMSWGAGIGEEYVCRNYVMPILDYKFGAKKGLFYSSVIFGTAHLSNLLFSDKPDYLNALLQVGEATIAGYFLGQDVQKRNYKIGPAVAAHMWYDFTLMLGSFLINPKKNYLGVNLRFKI